MTPSQRNVLANAAAYPPHPPIWQLAIEAVPTNRMANALSALRDVQDACFLPLASC
jgi:hypothetical protein